jgi:hypothetical protein
MVVTQTLPVLNDLLIYYPQSVSVRDTCKHYLLQSVSVSDKLERCKLKANRDLPFACPEDCLFFEARAGISKVGWRLPNPKKDDSPPQS